MRLRGCEVWFVWKANIALSLCVPACLLAAGIRRSTCSAAEAVYFERHARSSGTGPALTGVRDQGRGQSGVLRREAMTKGAGLGEASGCCNYTPPYGMLQTVICGCNPMLQLPCRP